MYLHTCALLAARLTAAVSLAALLVFQTGFALQCRAQQRNMHTLLLLHQQRHRACFALKLRWEADDQQQQYTGSSSAGTAATVGPIAGYVMDVSEDDTGHARGDCHPLHASYRDLVTAER